MFNHIHNSYLKIFLPIAFIFFLFLIPTDAEAGVIFRTNNNLGLVGYWKLDDASGTSATDSSGQGNTGTLTNMEEADWVDGKRGKALDFDGVDDYIDFGNIHSFEYNDPFSVSFWAKWTGTTGMQFVGKENNDGNFEGWQVNYNSDKIRWALINDGFPLVASILDTTSTSYNDGEWHHIVGTTNGAGDVAGMNLYVDGIDVPVDTTDTLAGNSIITAADFEIGGRDNGANLFSGTMDDVRIYNRALSAAEVKDLFSEQALKFQSTQDKVMTDGLVGYWSFNGKTMYNNVGDSSGQGNHGSLVGFTSTSTAVTIGKTGQALSFDGVDDYVDLGDDTIGTDLNGSSGATVSLWVNYDSLDSTKYDNVVFSTRINGGNSGTWINIENDGTVLVGGRSASADSFSEDISTATVSQGNWHHVVGILNFASDQISIAVDGVHESPASVTFGSNTYTQGNGTLNDKIGDHNGGNRLFDGKIDEVRIYNRALSASEITRLYNLGK